MSTDSIQEAIDLIDDLIEKTTKSPLYLTHSILVEEGDTLHKDDEETKRLIELVHDLEKIKTILIS